MKIEVGKTYRVMKEYNQYGGYKKGDTLEVTYIDDSEGGRVNFLYNGTKSDFDSRVWLEKIELEEITLKPSKPAHYDTAIDTIAFAKANFSREQVEGFMRINAIKYLQRVKKGQILDDLKKSRSYIDMLIEMEEGK